MGSFSLKAKLTGVMLLTVSAIAAVVHFPWAYASRQNVNEMVTQLNQELMHGTQNEVSNLFKNVLSAQELIRSSLDQGLVQLDQAEAQGQFYLNLLRAYDNFTWVQFGFANGDYLGAQRQPDGQYSIIRRQWDESLGELGAPGTDLAAQQAQRADLARRYRVTQQWPTTVDQAEKTVQNYRLNPAQDWVRLDETRTSEVYYAPIRPFYEAAIAQPGMDVWTDVYVFRTSNAVGLDAATTYQSSPEGPVRGVISISFEIRQISEYLASLREADQGSVFIVNRMGELIAASEPELLADTFVSNETAKLISLEDVQEDSLVRIAYQALQEQGVTINEITFSRQFSYYDTDTRERYYVAIKSLGQLDWVVGTVMPESAFLEHIHRNQRRLLVAIVSFLGLGTVAAIWLSDRAIARPILAITDAAEAIELGHFYSVSLDETSKRSDELGRLSRVFQKMAKEVYARERNLKQQLQALQIEIDESRKEREVREIVETDFFQDLKVKAQNLRRRRQEEGQ